MRVQGIEDFDFLSQAAFHHANEVSLRERANQVLVDAEQAGLLVREGKHSWNNPTGQDQAGRELACKAWNNQVMLRRQADKSLIEKMKCEGKAYWQKRGIAVGSTVYAECPSFLPYLPATKIIGIAKVGKVGAYVSSKSKKGYLNPDAFLPHNI